MYLRPILPIALVLLALAACNHRANLADARYVAPPIATDTGEAESLRPTAHNTVRHAAYTPPQSQQRYTLDSGDHLRIVVFDQDNISRTYAVDGGGYVSMPLIGAVRARGLTTFDLEKRIAAQLADGYVRDPKVTVEIETYRPFFVLGEVQRPGQYPYVNGMTVQTAVAIAGGFTERAKERSVELTRRFEGESKSAMVPDNFPVEPGDTVNVRERFF